MKAKKILINRTYYKWTFATFNPSSSLQEFSVPAGTKKLIVDCVASKGADYSATLKGANGGRVQCTLPITAPTTLYVYVGAVPSVSNIAEYNASDIRTDNTGVLDATSLSSRLIVAGGGGSKGSSTLTIPGAGGGLIGGDGGGYGGNNGKGGTQTAGGAAGDSTSYAHAGSFGLGGSNNRGTHTGAGGAGWYGGGSAGGSGGFSGGGGSSYTDSSCGSVNHIQGYNEGVGYVKIKYAVVSTSDDYDYYEEEATYSLVNKPIGDKPVYYGIKGFSRGEVYNPISPVGYAIQGNPTISNGIVSGFSPSSYVYVSKGFNPGSLPWESVTKARVNSFTNKCTIISYQFSGTKSFQLGVGHSGNDGKLIFYASTDGSHTDIANNIMSSLTINLNTWYWFKVRFTGTAYEVLVSEDNENWTNYISVSSTLIIRQNTQNSYGFNFDAYPEVLDGEIDLNETYIKYAGAYWFRGDMKF